MDLRDVVMKREFRYSLQTGYLRQARPTAMKIALMLKGIFNFLRTRLQSMTKLQREMIPELVDRLIRKELADDEHRRIEIARLRESMDDFEWTMYQFENKDKQETPVDRQIFLREDLSEGNHQHISPKAEEFLNESKIQYDRNSLLFHEFCRETLKKEINLQDVFIDRDRGFYNTDYPGLISFDTVAGHSVTKNENNDIKLSKVLDKYLQEAERSNLWKNSSRMDYEYILKLFVEILEDVPIVNINGEKARKYSETLQALPPNFSKSKKYKGMSIKQIAKMNHSKTLSVDTYNKHVSAVSTFMNWAVNRCYISSNYFVGLKMRKNRAAREERNPFDKQDLRLIFSKDLYPVNEEDKPFRFWTPIIALFSGMRLEEICQLHLDDIRQENGIWVFYINDNDEKTLKNNNSARYVPIHRFLLNDLKLIKYRNSLLEKGESRLFPELRKDSDKTKYSKVVSSWFSNYKNRKLKLEGKKSFHSFRHTFLNQLKQSNVQPAYLSEIAGHTVGTITMDRYTGSYSPENLYHNAIKHLDYGIDLSHLTKSPLIEDL